MPDSDPHALWVHFIANVWELALQPEKLSEEVDIHHSLPLVKGHLLEIAAWLLRELQPWWAAVGTAPEDMLVMRDWEIVRLRVDAAACGKQCGVDALEVVISRPIVVGIFRVWTRFVVVARERERKDSVANFGWDSDKERRAVLRVGSALQVCD
jgi:hypothetical protein